MRYSAIETGPATAVATGSRADVLRRELDPTNWDEARPVLAQLFSLPMKDGQNDDALLAAYQITVHDQPLWALKESVVAFITGKVGSGFCPSSAELGKDLDARTSMKRWELQRELRKEREAKALEADHRPSGSSPFDRRHKPVPRGFYALEINGQRLFSHDEVLTLHRKRRLPVGSYWRAVPGDLMMPEGTRLEEATLGIGAAPDGGAFDYFPDRDDWKRAAGDFKPMPKEAT